MIKWKLSGILLTMPASTHDSFDFCAFRYTSTVDDDDDDDDDDGDGDVDDAQLC